MRWDSLRLIEPEVDEATGEAMPLTLFDRGAVTRRFDTPEFRGITFYEVHARTIINRVPAASRMPFRWTINPYRGCSHACTYCLAGDTPILMADGRTKPLAKVQVGDEIYGTVREGRYRRYVKTPVLAHWATTKPAYRIVLEDGTELVASGDHRFLTERGWKHVTSAGSGSGQRPHLTPNNHLIGTGRFAEPPPDSADYRTGYLCGMIRGDASLGSCHYPDGSVHRFRLALADLDALDRARRYLADLGIATTEFDFPTAPGRRPMRAIRTSAGAAVAAVQELIRWPAAPTVGWRQGFLAGIFDAEGSNGRNVIRIANRDQVIIKQVTQALSGFGFDYVVEDHGRANNLCHVRIRGGLRETLRFLHSVDPAIERKRSIAGMAV